MNRFRKRYAPLVVIAVTVLATFAWSWYSLEASANAAESAAADLATCRRLAARVTALSKNVRSVSAAGEFATPELSRLIESAAATAGIARESLIRISPETPRPREGRAYREESTEVVLHAVSVEQTVRFLHALSGASPALRPTNLRLIAPPESAESGGAWNVEIRLLLLVYAPIPPQKLTGLHP